MASHGRVMVLLDSSAWIEFLRATGSSTALRVRAAIADATAAVTDVVIAEVLAGLAPARVDAVTRLLERAEYLAQVPFDDAVNAAAIYRACRAAGQTPRSLADCLIASVAVRADVPVLHCDRDFDLISRHSALEVA